MKRMRQRLVTSRRNAYRGRRHPVRITWVMGQREWLFVLTFAGGMVLLLGFLIIVRGWADWLILGLESIVLWLLGVALYCIYFATGDLVMRGQRRYREWLTHTLRKKDATIALLEAQANAGVAQNDDLQNQHDADQAEIKKLTKRIKQLEDTNLQEWEIKRLTNVITNQQTRIDHLLLQLSQRKD